MGSSGSSICSRETVCAAPPGPALSAGMHRPAQAACTRHSCDCCRALRHLVARMCKLCTALQKGAQVKPGGTSGCRQTLKRAILMLAMSQGPHSLLHKADEDVGIADPGCITEVLLLCL